MQPVTELDLGFAQGSSLQHKTFCTEPRCGEEVHGSPQPSRRADGDQRPRSELERGKSVCFRAQSRREGENVVVNALVFIRTNLCISVHEKFPNSPLALHTNHQIVQL